jgi:hypothetical protein
MPRFPGKINLPEANIQVSGTLIRQVCFDPLCLPAKVVDLWRSSSAPLLLGPTPSCTRFNSDGIAIKEARSIRHTDNNHNPITNPSGVVLFRRAMRHLY